MLTSMAGWTAGILLLGLLGGPSTPSPDPTVPAAAPSGATAAPLSRASGVCQ